MSVAVRGEIIRVARPERSVTSRRAVPQALRRIPGTDALAGEEYAMSGHMRLIESLRLAYLEDWVRSASVSRRSEWRRSAYAHLSPPVAARLLSLLPWDPSLGNLPTAAAAEEERKGPWLFRRISRYRRFPSSSVVRRVPARSRAARLNP